MCTCISGRVIFENTVYKHKTIIAGFFGRSEYPKTSSGLRDAIAARKDI